MKRHPHTQRDAMNEIQDRNSTPQPTHNDIKYTEPNRDRAVGNADRTGRHFDEITDDSIRDAGNPVRDAD
jgi:hypothetical protein